MSVTEPARNFLRRPTAHLHYGTYLFGGECQTALTGALPHAIMSAIAVKRADGGRQALAESVRQVEGRGERRGIFPAECAERLERILPP